ncbi:MAG TPA: hypothetical protein VNU93_04870, partial [Verrucomicrobiae bacterium]|nr:hypothetical protein [Verrucomicrobiae bacterium]
MSIEFRNFFMSFSHFRFFTTPLPLPLALNEHLYVKKNAQRFALPRVFQDLSPVSAEGWRDNTFLVSTRKARIGFRRRAPFSTCFLCPLLQRIYFPASLPCHFVSPLENEKWILNIFQGS